MWSAVADEVALKIASDVFDSVENALDDPYISGEDLVARAMRKTLSTLTEETICNRTKHINLTKKRDVLQDRELRSQSFSSDATSHLVSKYNELMKFIDADDSTSLVESMRDFEELDYLLDFQSVPKRQTLIMAAVRKGKLNATRTLISIGSKCNQFDEFGETAFHIAAQVDGDLASLSLTRMMLEMARADPTVKTRNEVQASILYLASKAGNVLTTSFLISLPKMKAITNQQTFGGVGPTPLHAACAIPDLKVAEAVVKILAAADADPSIMCPGQHLSQLKTLRGTYEPSQLVSAYDVAKRELRASLVTLLEPLAQRLAEAAAEKDTIALTRLLKHGASVEIGRPGVGGKTLLMFSAIAANLDAMSSILRRNADVNAIDATGYTALHHVCAATIDTANPSIRWRSVACVNFLLEAKADVNITTSNYGLIAAHLCIMNQRTDLLRTLVEHHPDLVNVPIALGDTPLHLAAGSRNPEMVAFLLSQRADVSTVNSSNDSALKIAFASGDRAIVEMLQSELIMMFKSAVQERNVELVQHLIDCGLSVSDMDLEGDCILNIICGSFTPALLDMFLPYCNQEIVNRQDSSGVTALHVLASTHPETDEEEEAVLIMASALIDCNADVSLRAFEDELAPIHVAAAIVSRKERLVGLLSDPIVNGGHYDMKTISGDTPLHLMASANNIFGIDILLKNQESVRQFNTAGQAPIDVTDDRDTLDILQQALDKEELLVAVSQNDIVSVSEIVLRGVDPNFLDREGLSPAGLAATLGHFAIVNHLLYAGAKVNMTNFEGKSVFHLLCESEGVESVEGISVLEACINIGNANVLLRSFNGETAGHIAVGMNRVRALEVLFQLSNREKDVPTPDSPSLFAMACGLGRANCLRLILRYRMLGDDATNHASFLEAIHTTTDETCAEILRAELSQMFLAAVAKCDVEAVALLLKTDADPNAPFPDGSLPLVAAAALGDPAREVVSTLLSFNADVNAAMLGTKKTAMHAAAQVWNGSTIINILVDAGGAVDVFDKYMLSPLMYGVKNKTSHCVEVLLKAQANVNLIGHLNQTALHIAAEQNILSTAWLLLEFGADTLARDANNMWPSEIAAELGYFDMQNLLTSATFPAKAIADDLLDKGVSVQSLSDARPPSSQILSRQLPTTPRSTVKSLRRGPSNPQRPSHTPLAHVEPVHPKIARAHADHPPPKSTEIEKIPVDYSALMPIAAQNNDVVRMSTLLRKRADPFLKFNGSTPLYIAAANGNFEVVQFMIDNVHESPDLCVVQNADGLSAIHVSALFPELAISASMVQAMIACGADINALSAHKDSPLHIAVMAGNIPVVDMLCAASELRINAQNIEGATALHIAADAGDADIVLKLLHAKADPMVKNGMWQLPIQIAEEQQYSNVEALLHASMHHLPLSLSVDKNGDPPPRSSVDKNQLRNRLLRVAQKNVLWIDKGSYSVDPSEREKLFAAVTAADVEQALELIDNGLSLEVEDEKGVTALILSAAHGDSHLELTEMLLKRGAIVDKFDAKGMTALHHACYQGDRRTVRLLIENGGANPDLLTNDPQGYGPTHIAIAAGNFVVTQYLMSREHRLKDAPSVLGQTPLHVACEGGSRAFVELLLASGENPLALNHLHASPYISAQDGGFDDLCLALKMVYKGLADVAIDSDNESDIRIMMNEGTLSMELDGIEDPPLIKAVNKSKLKVLRTMLELHADPNVCDASGLAAILHAASFPDDSLSATLVKTLLEHKADPGVPSPSPTYYPHHLAVIAHNPSSLPLLFSHGLKHDILSDDGEAALHIAARLAATRIADVLVECGEDITCLNSDGKTAWEVAEELGNDDLALLLRSKVQSFVEIRVKEDDLESVTKLAYCGAQVDGQYYTEESLTLLMLAASVGSVSLCKYFIEKKGDVNAKHVDTHKTALHFAAQSADDQKALSVMRLLLENKADMFAKCIPEADDPSQSVLALHLAALAGNTRVVYWLCTSVPTFKANRTPSGEGLLHLAARSSSLALTKMLTDQGLDLTMIDDESKPPIAYATVPSLSRLLQQKAQDRLEQAVIQGKSGDVGLLITAGGDVGYISSASTMPLLHTAVHHGHAATTLHLIRRNADPNVPHPETKLNALHYLCSLPHVADSRAAEIARVLVDIGKVDLNARVPTPPRPSAVLIAAGTAKPMTVSYLISRPSYLPNLLDEDGNSAMHIAAATGNLETVQVLIEKNENVAVLNFAGLIPADLAINSGYPEIAHALQNALTLQETRVTMALKAFKYGIRSIRSVEDFVEKSKREQKEELKNFAKYKAVPRGKYVQALAGLAGGICFFVEMLERLKEQTHANNPRLKYMNSSSITEGNPLLTIPFALNPWDIADLNIDTLSANELGVDRSHWAMAMEALGRGVAGCISVKRYVEVTAVRRRGTELKAPEERRAWASIDGYHWEKLNEIVKVDGLRNLQDASLQGLGGSKKLGPLRLGNRTRPKSARNFDGGKDGGINISKWRVQKGEVEEDTRVEIVPAEIASLKEVRPNRRRGGVGGERGGGGGMLDISERLAMAAAAATQLQQATLTSTFVQNKRKEAIRRKDEHRHQIREQQLGALLTEAPEQDDEFSTDVHIDENMQLEVNLVSCSGYNPADEMFIFAVVSLGHMAQRSSIFPAHTHSIRWSQNFVFPQVGRSDILRIEVFETRDGTGGVGSAASLGEVKYSVLTLNREYRNAIKPVSWHRLVPPHESEVDVRVECGISLMTEEYMGERKKKAAQNTVVPETLYIVVLRAQGLPPKDDEGSVSAFCRVYIGGECVHTTRTVSSVDPVWEEEAVREVKVLPDSEIVGVLRVEGEGEERLIFLEENDEEKKISDTGQATEAIANLKMGKKRGGVSAGQREREREKEKYSGGRAINAGRHLVVEVLAERRRGQNLGLPRYLGNVTTPLADLANRSSDSLDTPFSEIVKPLRPATVSQLSTVVSISGYLQFVVCLQEGGRAKDWTATTGGVDCINGCGIKLNNTFMRVHLQYACRKAFVPCPYIKRGCPEMCLREKLADHSAACSFGPNQQNPSDGPTKPKSLQDSDTDFVRPSAGDKLEMKQSEVAVEENRMLVLQQIQNDLEIAHKHHVLASLKDRMKLLVQQMENLRHQRDFALSQSNSLLSESIDNAERECEKKLSATESQMQELIGELAKTRRPGTQTGGNRSGARVGYERLGEGGGGGGGGEVTSEEAMKHIVSRTGDLARQRDLFGAKGLTHTSSLRGCSGRFINMCRIPNEPFLCTFTDNEKCIKVWDVNSYACLRSFKKLRGMLTSMISLPSWGNILISGGSYPEDDIRVWDLSATSANESTCLGYAGEHDAINAIVKLGEKIVSGDENSGISVWDIHTKKRDRRLAPSAGKFSDRNFHTLGILSLATDRDESCVYSGSSDQTVKVWDPRIWSAQHTLSDTTDVIKNLRLSGYQLIGAGSFSTTIWDIRTLGTLSKIQAIAPIALAGDLLVTASSNAPHAFVRWDPRTWALLDRVDAHSTKIASLESHRGKIFTGSSDSEVKVWESAISFAQK